MGMRRIHNLPRTPAARPLAAPRVLVYVRVSVVRPGFGHARPVHRAGFADCIVSHPGDPEQTNSEFKTWLLCSTLFRATRKVVTVLTVKAVYHLTVRNQHLVERDLLRWNTLRGSETGAMRVECSASQI